MTTALETRPTPVRAFSQPRPHPNTGPLPQPSTMPACPFKAKNERDARPIPGTGQDTLLFSSRNPFTGQTEGFDVDMGRLVAQVIFGDPNTVPIKFVACDDRVDAPRTRAMHIVADTMTANCARWQDVNFSSIYHETGQKVPVSSDSPAPAPATREEGGKGRSTACDSTKSFGDGLVAHRENGTSHRRFGPASMPPLARYR